MRLACIQSFCSNFVSASSPSSFHVCIRWPPVEEVTVSWFLIVVYWYGDCINKLIFRWCLKVHRLQICFQLTIYWLYFGMLADLSHCWIAVTFVYIAVRPCMLKLFTFTLFSTRCIALENLDIKMTVYSAQRPSLLE